MFCSFSAPTLIIRNVVNNTEPVCPHDFDSTQKANSSILLIDGNMTTCLEVTDIAFTTVELYVANNDQMTINITMYGSGLECESPSMEVYVPVGCTQDNECEMCPLYQSCSFINTSSTKCTLYCQCIGTCNFVYIQILSSEKTTNICEFVLI